MNAFLFPGQGSQEIGMAADLFKSDAYFKSLVRHASDRVNANLEHICLRGPERELVRTKHLQPLLVCVSLGYLRHLTERGIQPGVVLGHSLGEITALAAAGVVTAEEAIDMAAVRGAHMDAAAMRVAGGMIAVLSNSREKILQWVAGMPCQRIVLANDNAPGQLVLSGEHSALDEAAQWVRQEKLGTCRKLPVAGPWHSPFMAQAQLEFEHWLKPMTFRAPRLPVIFNASATREDATEVIRHLASRNLSHPVLWRACMEQLKHNQTTALFEIGPGRILAGLARANGFGDEARVCSINNLRGIEQALKSPGAN